MPADPPPNPYAVDHNGVGLDLGFPQRDDEIPAQAGLTAFDIHRIAARNYRLGRKDVSDEFVAERTRLHDARARAWDEGLSAGEEHAYDVVQCDVEAILSVIEHQLATPGSNPLQTMREAHQLARGARIVLTDHEVVQEADPPRRGLTVKGFQELERVLREAAAREE